MGLLDDAIREHLELKRRRGADPAEVERAEREALGPVRRNRDPADPDHEEPLAAGPQADDEFDPAEPNGSGGREGADAAGGPGEPGGPGRPEEAGYEPFDADREPPSPQRGWASHDVGDEDLYGPFEPRLGEPEGPETAEYHVGGDGESDEDDDMLEETPEFLQDTPDHDRLWFEQRPPRDFDFDG